MFNVVHTRKSINSMSRVFCPEFSVQSFLSRVFCLLFLQGRRTSVFYVVITLSSRCHRVVIALSSRCHHVSSGCHHVVITLSSRCHRVAIALSSRCHRVVITLSSRCHHVVITFSSRHCITHVVISDLSLVFGAHINHNCQTCCNNLILLPFLS